MRVLLLGFIPTLLAGQQTVDFIGRYWMPQMTARIRVEAGGFGTDIDARADLGMKDTNFPEGNFTWQKGRSLLTYSYTPIDYSADQNVNRTVVFRGRQYTIGTRVVSDLEIQHLHLAWAYQFVRFHEGMVRLGPMVGADGFLMHGALAAPAFQITEKEDLSVGFPVVGLALDIQPWRWIDIYGQAAGMDLGSYGYFIGSDAGVKVTAWRHVLLTAGYRTFNLHVENSPDFARLHIGGPFVGAGFRF
jgi:hypothetical protein